MAAIWPAPESQAPQLAKAPLKQVLTAMTLEEKASLAVRMGMGPGQAVFRLDRPLTVKKESRPLIPKVDITPSVTLR